MMLEHSNNFGDRQVDQRQPLQTIRLKLFIYLSSSYACKFVLAPMRYLTLTREIITPIEHFIATMDFQINT